MLLPQSSAFAALKNRLNSVSNIGLLHSGPRAYVSPKNTSSSSTSSFDHHHSRKRSTETHAPAGINSPITSSSAASSYERPTGRLKTREENVIRWVELLDKFKSVQERARKSHLTAQGQLDDEGGGHSHHPSFGSAVGAGGTQNNGKDRDVTKMGLGVGNGAGPSAPAETGAGGLQRPTPMPPPVQKSKSSLGNFGRLASGIGPRKSKR